MADWHTSIKPKIDKTLADAVARLEYPGLAADKTEFLRGQIYALRIVLAAALEKPKPE